ncbi:MAG TPA: M50 family metallopeptidase [Pyrinomonadaceae bacterium]|nr:M50 family metallopeptidase [Pyrinomonadaceae bacterium]
MRYSIADDARPQVKLLIVATIASFVLWLMSMYLPLVGYVVYPLQLFATFIHEGGHVLAAILTGSSVQSLTVSPDTSGEVYSMGSGWCSQLFISSAGYVGTTAFGAAMLVWIRYGFSSRRALYISSAIIGVLTVFFGILAPVWNFFANVTIGSLAFTVFSGIVLTVGLFAVARFASLKWTNFAVAFLAVQCLLNAMFSLMQLFVIAGFTNMHSDAANMAAATGLPGIIWVFIWMGLSILLISVGLRLYAVSRITKTESVFED